jgi:DnaK suppressor protein
MKPKKRASAPSSTSRRKATPTERSRPAARTAATPPGKPTSRRRAKPVVPTKAVRQKDGQVRAARGRTVPGGAAGDVRTETSLTAADTALFREALLAKRAEILGDVSTLHNEAVTKDRQDATGDLSSMPIHMADLGTDNYELEFTLGLIEGERAILREIDEALERIRQGTYGVCLATGRPIGKARLKAKPWAKYCYEYTLAQEQGQGRRF